MQPDPSMVKVRLDKWLWAARFFKTRSAATEAVQGGKIEVNGDAAKPSRLIQPGDKIRVRIAPDDWHLSVTAVADRRGSAEAAAGLFAETDASRLERERQREQRRLAPNLDFGAGKPTRKDRRALQRWRGRE